MRDRLWNLYEFILTLRPGVIFNLRDSDSDGSKTADISIAIHLVLFILAIFPYDFFQHKPIEEKRVNIAIMRSGGKKAIQNNNQRVEPEEAHVSPEIPESPKIEKPDIEKKVAEVKPDVAKEIELKKPDQSKTNIPKKDPINKAVATPNDKLASENTKSNMNTTDAKTTNTSPTNTSQSSANGNTGNSADILEGLEDVNDVTSAGKNSKVYNARAIISSVFHKHWIKAHLATKAANDLGVKVVVFFDKDGNITNYKIIEPKSDNDVDEMYYQELISGINIVMLNCKTVPNLPVESYNSWKEVVLTFKYSAVS